VQQLVRPTETPITPFCTSLTGITPEAAASGVELSDAIARVEREVALMEGGGLGENTIRIIVQWRLWLACAGISRSPYQMICLRWQCATALGPLTMQSDPNF
jgi:hypothetical protein